MEASLATRYRRLVAALAVLVAFAVAPAAVRADLLVSSLSGGTPVARVTDPIDPHDLPAGGRTAPLVYRPRDAALGRRRGRTFGTLPAAWALLLVMAQPPPTGMLQSMGIHASSVNGDSLYTSSNGGGTTDGGGGPPTQHMPEPASLVSAAVGTILALLFALSRRRRAVCLRPA